MTEETEVANGYANEPVHKSKSPKESSPVMSNGNGDVPASNESKMKPSVTVNQSSNDASAGKLKTINLSCTENEGPTQILPSEELWTSDPAGRIKIRGKDLEECPPISVPGLLNRTATNYPDRIALALKQPDGKYQEITYKQYEENVRIVAKAFIHLGLERYSSVGIIGFNSPEWFYTDLAAIYAGYRKKILNILLPTNFKKIQNLCC
ncbi:long-chain-fatty-acid--CoA ligase ACSBG2-like [Nilaparvata lugens]|uniref:long-chain-fatty-acid--CoA ligase ACSBG2-like n=1 Tax=Nilaparvata lugens TaxID=108931 RepID=UPI00193EC19A|nr:long-chain-fatty-acid--CoA ligase ACSBG2-like [Nilaparvata lugens]